MRRGLRGPVVGRVDETRLPPFVIVNPLASAQESNGAQPGDLTMREAAHQTNPMLPADDLTAGQDNAAGDSPAAASQGIEE